MGVEKLLSFYLKKFQGLSGQVWAGLAAVFTNSLGATITLFLSLFLVTERHFSVADSGILITVFGVGSIFGSYLSGNLCNKYSSYIISVFSLVINSIVLLVIPFLKDFYLLIIAIAFMGAANASFVPANRVWLMRHCEEDQKSRVNSLRFMIVNLGMGVAVFIGGFLAKHSYTLFFSFNSLVVFLSAIILLSFGQAEEKINVLPSVSSDSRNFFARFPFFENRGFFFSYLILFFVSLVFSQLRITYPLYLKSEYNLNTALFSYLFLINTIFIVIFQVSIVEAVGRFNQFLIAGVGSFIVGAGMFVLLLGSSYSLAIFSCLLWTVGEILAFPIIQMLLYNRAKESTKTIHVGLYQSVYSFSNVIGPALGSWAYKFYKGMGAWILCGILGLMCLCIGLVFKNEK